MGTYLLGTVYDVIAPFLLRIRKMLRIKNDQHDIFRSSLASFLRILPLFKVRFFFRKFHLILGIGLIKMNW